jgi:hypothetical protein
MDLLNTARVRVVAFAPRARQIFQLLDLTLFGIFKHQEKYYLPFGDLETTLDFVYNVCPKTAKTVSLSNIWATVEAIEVEFDTGIVPNGVILSYTRKS